jgi:hypothetical protein
MWRKALVAGTIAASLFAGTALAVASPGDHQAEDLSDAAIGQPWGMEGDLPGADPTELWGSMGDGFEMEGAMGGFGVDDMVGLGESMHDFMGDRFPAAMDDFMEMLGFRGVDGQGFEGMWGDSSS